MNADTWYLSHSDLTEFKEVLGGHFHSGIGDLLEKYYPISASITIFVALISCFLFIILIFWERFGMDPMKRGIKNRVSLFELKTSHDMIFQRLLS